MYIGQISNHPTVNADRYISVTAEFAPNEIILHCTISFRDGAVQILPELIKKKSFSALYNMVNPQTGAAVHRTEQGDEILDENNVGTGEYNMVYPEGSIPEIVFLQNIPMTAFTNVTTVWDAMKTMIVSRVQAMDAVGAFNF